MTFPFYLTRLLEEQQTKYIPQNSQSPLNTRTNGEYSAFPLNTETLPLPFAAEYNYFLYLEHCCFEKRSFGVERQSSSVEHRVIPPRTMFPTQFYNNTTFSFVPPLLFFLPSTQPPAYVVRVWFFLRSFFPPHSWKMLSISCLVEYFRQTFSGEFWRKRERFWSGSPDLCAETLFPHVRAGSRSTLADQTTRRLPSALYHVCAPHF